MIKAPTTQQAEVIGTVERGEPDDLAVVARAGSGKTSTILAAVEARPRGMDVTLCAFNKAIAEELRARVKVMAPAIQRGVWARTLHGIGKRAVDKAFGKDVVVDDNRERMLAVEVCGDQEEDRLLGTVARLASSAKECAPDDATEYQAIERVGADLGFLPDDEEHPGWTCAKIIRAAADVVRLSAEVQRDRRISYSDMLYVPLVHRLKPDQSDLVVVDEAQDMNLAQLRLAARCRKPGGRFVVVGDDRQAIYSWRGAAPGALDRVRLALRARLMRLTVTHRCATAIVAEAQRFVPDLEAAPGAPIGIVRDAMWATVTGAEIGDFVIGRTNASLASTCMHLLRHGVRAKIAGGKLGEALIAIVRRLSVGTQDLLVFIGRLDTWREREVAKAEMRQAPAGAAHARDCAETLEAIAEECETVTGLVAKIRDLFADDGRGHVVCSTVHRAKGLEADRVWLLRDSFDGFQGTNPSGEIEEQNLMYVAITRARRELVRLSGQKAHR